jgi:hypothetical protein
LYLPELDFEYLIRTLSEARSRATELAVSIGSRLGSEHRLAQLANAAASSVENTLREIRKAASLPDRPSGLADLQGALQTETRPPAPPQALHESFPAMTSFADQAGLDAEHWLPAFVNELVAQVRISGAITFEQVERLLQHRKDEFLRDFLTARRMYRTYPHLFPEIADETRQAFTP